MSLQRSLSFSSLIAVAFVATIYGVGLANLVYLPIANKLKARFAVIGRNIKLLY